jgi:flagellar protein FlaJ
MYFERKYKLMVWGASIAVALALFILTIVQGVYVPTAKYMIPIEQNVNNIFAVALLIAIFPSSLIELTNSIWLRQVDKNIPRLLMDVTESVRSGLSLFDALEIATTKDYGPITEHLEDALVRFNLTSDFEGALNWLGEKLVRKNAKRLVTILMEAYETGGRMIQVLETSVDMFTGISEYKDEKESQMTPYILLVYVGTIIFLGISFTILNQFLTPLMKTGEDPLVAQAGIVRFIDINYYKAILYWAGVMEGLLGGFVAGKIRDNRIGGGLIHSVILLLITIVFFNVVSV